MPREHGAALVSVVMATALLAAATVGIVMSTRSEVAVAAAFVRGSQAQYAAEAGIHRALVDLRMAPDWTAALDGSVTSTFVDDGPDEPRPVPGGAVVDIRRLQSLATCGRQAPCADGDRAAVTVDRPWGANNPRWRPFAYGPLAALTGSAGLELAAPAYLVVFVGDDAAEEDGNPDRDGAEGRPGGGIVRLRSYGFAAGGARRVVEAVVGRTVGGRVRVLQWYSE